MQNTARAITCESEGKVIQGPFSLPPREWKDRKRWNPFNSYKLLAHVDRWRLIKRGKAIPAPITITVDPTNICNFNCAWCNAEYIRKHRKRSLSEKTMNALADFLPFWGANSNVYEPGVKSICVAGGGEPLLNPSTPNFIERVTYNGIEVGIVTNGSHIDDGIDALSRCTWVGVSVDAGRPETLDKLKGLNPKLKSFDRIVNNISILVDYSKRHQTRLSLSRPGYGVSFKYLLYKDNIGEIFEATKIAKEIGCKNIHFRPAGTPWDKIGTDAEIVFTPEDIQLFNEQMALATELDDANFGVYGVTHKFNEQFKTCNSFDKCYSIFMTAVIEPPKNRNADKDAFIMGLCCDRRGDRKLELLTEETDVHKINQVWGDKCHWSIHDRINVEKECPRCTYQPHNQIYEQVILNDSMTYKFI
jgi:MoaA/NifB/PqqE/SkfB family radical SAM enzyme